MQIIKVDAVAIKKAVNILKAGGLVIYPTETVYGMGVDATNKGAVEKLNKYKARPLGKTYSIAVSDKKMAEGYASLNEAALNLYREFLPGPLTVISKGKHKVAKGVESEIGTIGIRIPDYPLVIEIIKKLGKPVTATSANASYKKRPYKISDILENISSRQKALIDLIIDAGALPKNEPSTVIDTTSYDISLLRQGGIKIAGENKILSRSEEETQNTAKEILQKYQDYFGKRSIVFGLEGPMGAGKTCFTKGLARAMGISETVSSPTYNIINDFLSTVYGLRLNHIDVWRIQEVSELESLGFIKMLEDKNAVIAIEWAEKVADLIKKYRDQAVIVWVKISYARKENERFINWDIL